MSGSRSWREVCPDLAIRSTFIVGFPGETEADFAAAARLAARGEARARRLLPYEPVEGARANDLPGAVPDEVKEERWHRFMAAQQEVSARAAWRPVGREIDVIIDEVDEEGALGRSQWDAPEIDGSVFLEWRHRREARRHRQSPRRPRRRIRPVGYGGASVK